MMLSDPEGFKRKAREWAIRYANAPSTTVSSSHPTTSKAISNEDQRHRDKLRQLQGYDERLVDQFMDMGFSISDVVNALRRVGVKPGGQSRISESLKQSVAESLLGL